MASAKKSKAVALKYNVEEDLAPIVIASGYGEVAERIIGVAEQRGIPVFRDDSAVSLLCMLEVGSNIPPELYEVVAAIYCQLLKTSRLSCTRCWMRYIARCLKPPTGLKTAATPFPRNKRRTRQRRTKNEGQRGR